MKWPTDSEASKRRRQEAADFGWGFLTGIVICVVVSILTRAC